MALFMDNLPEDNPLGAVDENDPDIMAMRAMMEETPEEAAELHKEQGNIMLQNSKGEEKYLRGAMDYYTKAIKEGSSIASNNSIYYANRAHVQLLLGNVSHALSDAKQAIQLNPHNVKAYFRATKAALRSQSCHLQVAADFCRRGLELDAANEELKKLLREIEEKLEVKEREAVRAEEARDRAKAKAAALRERGVRMGPPAFRERAGDGRPWLVEVDGGKKEMHWKVLLLYPEVMVADVINDFAETDTFEAHIDVMFSDDAPPLDWDKEGWYIRSRLELYLQTNSVPELSRQQLLKLLMVSEKDEKRAGEDDEDDNDDDSNPSANWADDGEKKWMRVKRHQMLADILPMPGHILPGLPVFYVVAKGSSFREAFISGKWNPP